MSWIDQLSEDLHLWSMRTDLSERERRISDAARLVLEGEDIWWCEAHKSVGQGCDKASAMFAMSGSAGDCRMVLRRMIGGSDAAE